MKHMRVAVIGISGRMGREIVALAPELAAKIVCGVAKTDEDKKSNVAIFTNIAELDAKALDVVIDFSLPQLTREVVQWCAEKKKPLVCGVTGLTAKDQKAIDQAASRVPLLWAPNMSLGIAVLAKMLEEFRRLQNFDFQVEEFHHSQKKDRPSGTAVFLQDKLKSVVAKTLPEPVAIRGGGVFGTHRVFAFGEEETLTLEHTAMNRRVFARGALQAAKWLCHQGPGRYQIVDVLES